MPLLGLELPTTLSFGAVCVGATLILWLLLRLPEQWRFGTRVQRSALVLGTVCAPAIMVLAAGQIAPPERARVVRNLELCVQGAAGAAATAAEAIRTRLPEGTDAEFPWHDFRSSVKGLCRIRIDNYFTLSESGRDIAYWATLEQQDNRWVLIALEIPLYSISLPQRPALATSPMP